MSLIGKGISVDNGLINIRSGDLKALTGGIVLQLNELPSKSPSATKRLAGAHISIVPENPRAGSILIASGGDPATTQSVVMQNMGAKIEIDRGPLSSIVMETSKGDIELKASKIGKAQIKIQKEGFISIRNQVYSLRQLLNDFIQDYLMHSHTHAGLAGTTAPINPLQFPTGGQVLIGINEVVPDIAPL